MIPNAYSGSLMLRKCHWFLVSALLAFGLLGGIPAAAQDSGPTLVPTAKVVAVDASTNPARAIVFSTNNNPGEATVAAAGVSSQSSSASRSGSAELASELIYVVDVNRRSAQGDAFDRIKTSIAESIETLPASTSIAVVAAGDSPIVLSELTTSREDTLAAVDELSFRSSSSLAAAVERATELLSSEPNVVRSIVTVATGPDGGASASSATQAKLVRSGAQLVVVQYRGGDPDLALAATASGGTSASAEGSSALRSNIFAASSVAAERLVVSFQTAEAAAGTRSNATLTIGETSEEFSFINGQYSPRISQIGSPVGGTNRLGFLSGVVALGVLIAFAFVGIAVAVWAISSMFLGRRRLDTLLERYEANDPSLSEEETREAVVESVFVKRAVQLSENFAERRGFLVGIERMLEKANLPIRAGEALVFLVVALLFAFAFGLLLTGSFFGAVILAIVVGVVSYFVVQFLAARRLKKFEAQLPDTLQLLAGTLRAGFSLPQGIDAVAKEIAPPMGEELRRAVTEAQLGRELEESLEGISRRVESPDFAWAVMAIGIQREVGGNLNELLMTVAETMIARERLRREVNSLTAEGRMSALILGLLPPGLGVVLGLGNPEYISKLFTDRVGNILLGVAVLSTLIGLAWMKKVITLDV